MNRKRKCEEAEDVEESPFDLWPRVRPFSLSTPTSPSKSATAAKSDVPDKRVFGRGHVASDFVGREEERSFVVSSVMSMLTEGRSGALYLSGLPGTGKTALMSAVRHDLTHRSGVPKHRFVHVNCMQLSSARHVFGRIFEDDVEDDDGLDEDAVERRLRNPVSRDAPVILVLDEMDSLVTRDNDVIYRLFDLCRPVSSAPSPTCRIVIIGIANSLDLISRRLPRLAVHACRPVQVSVRAYTQEQLHRILQHRQAGLPRPLVESSALELCARKVASKHGDARKALDVIFQALAEAEARGGSSSGDAPPLSIAAVHATLMANYASERARQLATLPLMAKRVLCALFAMTKRTKIALDDIRNVYAGQWRDAHAGGSVSREEFKTMCEPLVGMGVIVHGKSRADPWRAMAVELCDDDVEDALADDKVLTDILKRVVEKKTI